MSVTALLTPIAAGTGLRAMGIWTLDTCAWYDGVPAAELLVNRAAGIAPSPREQSNRRFNRSRAWMNIILGTFFTACLVAVVIASQSE